MISVSVSSPAVLAAAGITATAATVPGLASAGTSLAVFTAVAPAARLTLISTTHA